MVLVGGTAMNVPAYLAVLALIAMVVFCALEEQLQLAPLGFSPRHAVALRVVDPHVPARAVSEQEG
jgi:hypothetical protein